VGGFSGKGSQVKALVELLARSLVDHPEAVVVQEVDGPHATVVELRVSPDDLGKVIGRGGRVIKAIRILARAAATRSGKRVTVEIVRP
jgi:predicted RNA-binding protein YlqC (UPF0109 family)